MKRALTLILPLVVAIPGHSLAEIYRWIDKDGVTVYSQVPPADGRAELVRTPPRSASSDDDGKKQLQALEAKVRKGQQARARQQALKKDAAAKRAQDEKRCAQARQNKKNIPVQPNGLVLDSKGRTERLTLERWRQLHAESDSAIAKYCH